MRTPQAPSGWTWSKVKHLAEFFTGWTPPTGDAASFEGDNLWANISDLGERTLEDTAKRISDEAIKRSAIRISPAGSLLFSFKLSIGQVSFAGRDLYTNEAIATFPPKTGFNPRWAYWAFPVFVPLNANENIYGAKLLNQELIRAAAVLVPPEHQQERIANFLDEQTARIDALIAEKERLVERLSELRYSTVSWAVTGGLHQYAGTFATGNRFLPSLPLGWQLSGLTKHIGPVVDYRGKTPEKVSEGVLLVTARNIRAGKLDYDASAEFVRLDAYEEIMRRGKPELGDVLFTTEAPLGQVANVDRADIALAQRVVKFRGLSGVLDNYFLKYWLMGDAVQSTLQTLATGSTAEGIKASKFGQIPLALPSMPQQVEIVRFLDARLAAIDSANEHVLEHIDLLREYRSSLISAAVTGQLNIDDFQARQFEAA